ncbi:MAG: hypothetical protein H7263_02775 [Candidatus Sericytochromatia bacterium]|nr:hypothetical protein [Candidatus Sericytochromatia bacterium]
MALLDYLKKFSARTYLISAFALVSTIPVLMLSLIQYNYIDNNILTVMEKSNLSFTKSLAKKISLNIESNLKISDFILNQISDKDDLQIKDIFNNFSKSYNNFDLVYYNDQQKHLLIQDNNKFNVSTESEAKLDKYNFIEMSRNSKKNLFMYNIKLGVKNSLSAVLIPLYIKNNYKGYLLYGFTNNEVKNYLSENNDKFSNLVIINSDTSDIIFSEQANYKFNKSSNNLLENIKNSNSGIISRYISSDNIAKIVSYASLDYPRWTIWIEYPLSMYQDQIKNNAFRILLAAIISFLVAFSMGLWIAGSQQRFIKNFLLSIRAVAEGNYKKKVTSEMKLIPREFNLLIDEFNLMEEKIEQLDSFKSNLIDTVSHEFRTPLTSIKGFSSTLLRKDANFDIETQRKLLKIISSQSDRLSRMVEDLLVVPKLEGHVLQLNLQEIELDHTIIHISEFFPDDIYKIDVAENIWVLVDSDRFEQVLLNLFENAHKYTDPKGSTVKINAYKENDSVRIVVTNCSKNIAQDKLDSLFDKFFRLDDQLTRTTGGTGLGLYITKGLVELMQGRIWIESDNNEFRVNFTVPNAS